MYTSIYANVTSKTNRTTNKYPVLIMFHVFLYYYNQYEREIVQLINSAQQETAWRFTNLSQKKRVDNSDSLYWTWVIKRLERIKNNTVCRSLFGLKCLQSTSSISTW